MLPGGLGAAGDAPWRAGEGSSRELGRAPWRAPAELRSAPWRAPAELGSAPAESWGVLQQRAGEGSLEGSSRELLEGSSRELGSVHNARIYPAV